ncbi:BMC domain-containing protein [Klebsiella sp. 102043]|uniref:BMC domain-containing protein n=1 Tax=Klebsiella sp. 102043 TaxID=3079182 RepID=UPI003004F0F2
MIDALGLLEVEGMVAAVDAADAMLKAANVRLLSHEVLDPGRLTLVVEGDLAACRAAHFAWPLDKARQALEQLFSAGTLRKRSSRYRLKNP